MKKTKRDPRKPAPPPTGGGSPGARAALGFVGLLALGLIVYQPALGGPFLFDDLYLSMNAPGVTADLSRWLVVIRPLLTLSYWVNFLVSRTDTGSYHLTNLLLHAANALLVFVIVRRLVKAAPVDAAVPDSWLAGFCALLFLLHPVQTEAVAYIAGRSETLSVFFFYAAFAVFLIRPSGGVTWARAVAMLVLFVAALASKEHTVTLPALLLLADLYFNPGGFSLDGAKQNWRIYAPLAAGGLAGVVLAFRVLGQADSAGFAMKDVTWPQYLFTQFRVFFEYLRLFVLPVGLNIDYDYPFSKSLTDHGALFALAGIAVLFGLAWWLRKRMPLGSFGFFVFVLLLLPTSSVIPIRDPIAERRMYLPMIGLVLVAADLLRRWRVPRNTLLAVGGLVLAGCAYGTWQRAQVWGDALKAWEDTVAKSPNKPRAHFQLAYAYYGAGRCAEALEHYDAVHRLEGDSERLLVDWALAYLCLGRDSDALAKLLAAVLTQPTAHAWSTLGMVYGKMGRGVEAQQALHQALKLNPNYDMAYFYLGNLALAAGDAQQAGALYRRALEINPANSLAQQAFAQAQAGGRR